MCDTGDVEDKCAVNDIPLMHTPEPVDKEILKQDGQDSSVNSAVTNAFKDFFIIFSG